MCPTLSSLGGSWDVVKSFYGNWLIYMKLGSLDGVPILFLFIHLPHEITFNWLMDLLADFYWLTCNKS